MSKIKPDKINFNKDDFVVTVENNNSSSSKKNKEVTEADLEKNRINAIANEIIEKANKKAKEIIDKANKDKDIILFEAQNELKKAKEMASNEIDNANKEKDELIKNSKDEIEKQRAESAHEGYREGYQDGEKKLYEELNEKIEGFDKFIANQYEIKNKILKSASKDIIDIIFNISRKILLKEVDGDVIAKIIHKTVNLLEKKENINIILSEKYARLLFELQKKSINNEIELNFEEFKQFGNFNVLFNPKLNDDTIIVENQAERFDASINAQLDIIIRDILENTSNGVIEDIEEYGEE